MFQIGKNWENQFSATPNRGKNVKVKVVSESGHWGKANKAGILVWEESSVENPEKKQQHLKLIRSVF